MDRLFLVVSLTKKKHSSLLYTAVYVRDICFGMSFVSLGFGEGVDLDSSEGLPGVLERTATSGSNCYPLTDLLGIYLHLRTHFHHTLLKRIHKTKRFLHIDSRVLH